MDRFWFSEELAEGLSFSVFRLRNFCQKNAAECALRLFGCVDLQKDLRRLRRPPRAFRQHPYPPTKPRSKVLQP